MSDKPRVPAIEGWYTMNAEQPHLVGSRCLRCGTYFFPKQATSSNSLLSQPGFLQ